MLQGYVGVFLEYGPPTSYPSRGGLTSLDAAESGDVEMTMVEAAQERFVSLFFWGGVFFVFKWILLGGVSIGDFFLLICLFFLKNNRFCNPCFLPQRRHHSTPGMVSPHHRDGGVWFFRGKREGDPMMDSFLDME